METAVLGGGCFWCLEAVFEQLQGVASVVSGYCGGEIDHPSYAQVCQGDTGHAEVVRVEFDLAVISYRDLLEVFFLIHDPTTLNRQGQDVGSQYRSVIFCQSPQQEAVAREVIDDLGREGIWPAPLVTQVLPASPFFPAEDYHQGYFRNHPKQGYCAVVVGSKVAKFRQRFFQRLKPRYR